MQTSLENLSRRIEIVVTEHLKACQREAEAALTRAFSASARKVSRAGSGPRSTKAENRRSQSELALLRERVLKAVVARPGETMTVIAAEAGSTGHELQFPMRQLRQAKQVRSAGERGFTRYFPMLVPKTA